MAFPDNRAEFLTYLDQKRVDARTYGVYCNTSLADALAKITEISDSTTMNACMHLYSAISHLLGSVARLYDVQLSESPRAGLINFLENFTAEGNGDPPDEYELTWEKIVNVWLTAPDDGKLFTILAVDSLRKDIWEKPVTWQALAGEAGGL